MPQDQLPSFTIASSGLTADVSSRGAELVRLRDDGGRELLWDGDPTFWTGRAPILFPVVGRLKDDHVKVDGAIFPMRQHGFARTSTFDCVDRGDSFCRMRLRASNETRQSYPFDFELDVTYAVDGLKLEMAVTVANTGPSALPASVGFHPALRWPLPYGADRAAHEILFAKAEPGPITPLAGGLLSSPPASSPVMGRRLALHDGLFQNDALIFLHPASRSLRYGPAAGRSVTVDYPGMPQLGIWTKPGAGFLCIEPWHGYASPQHFDGELADKPGMTSVPAGGQATFGMSLTLDPA